LIAEQALEQFLSPAFAFFREHDGFGLAHGIADVGLGMEAIQSLPVVSFPGAGDFEISAALGETGQVQEGQDGVVYLVVVRFHNLNVCNRSGANRSARAVPAITVLITTSSLVSHQAPLPGLLDQRMAGRQLAQEHLLECLGPLPAFLGLARPAVQVPLAFDVRVLEGFGPGAELAGAGLGH
jgi:hypothetical protein